MPKMNPEVKAKWLEALRSGEYEQGHGKLRSGDDEYCCLGVLCDLAVKAGVVAEPVLSENRNLYYYDGFCEAAHPQVVANWSGVIGLGDFHDGERERTLAHINDEGASFSEIADIIESEF